MTKEFEPKLLEEFASLTLAERLAAAAEQGSEPVTRGDPWRPQTPQYSLRGHLHGADPKTGG